MSNRNGSLFSALPVVFFAISLTGCMAFQTNDARQFTSFPPSEIPAKDARIGLHMEATYQVVGMGATNDARQSVVDNITGWAENYLEQTGVFHVQADKNTADYRLVIRVRDDAEPNAGFAILTGLTLYILPSMASDNFTTDVELIDAEGNQVSEKQFKHQVKLVQQLFLIFGAPFATIGNVSEQMWQEILQDVSVWAAESVSVKEQIGAVGGESSL